MMVGDYVPSALALVVADTHPEQRWVAMLAWLSGAISCQPDEQCPPKPSRSTMPYVEGGAGFPSTDEESTLRSVSSSTVSERGAH